MQDEIVHLQGFTQLFRFSRRFDHVTVFTVIVFPVYERVHGFNIINSRKIKKGSQIVKHRKLWDFFQQRKEKFPL